MFKNFWYALDFSANVSTQPRRVTALMEEFVLYRVPSSQQAIVLSDLCVHRGGALSDGWMKDDCIVCPYHGWQYTADGVCVKIPANLPGVPIPKKARVDCYPTREQHGFVWAFLGDIPEAERPPLPSLNELPNAQVTRGEFKWNAPYTRVIEHLMNIAHAPFLYGSLPSEPMVEGFATQTTAWGASVNATVRGEVKKGWFGKQMVNAPARLSLHAPHITQHELTLPQGAFNLICAHSPVNARATITKWIAARSFAQADSFTSLMVEKIFKAAQHAIALGAEALSNELVTTFRRLNEEALQRGWAIDAHLIESEYSRMQAVVIPSPARKEVADLAWAWVMKEMPVRKVNSEQ